MKALPFRITSLLAGVLVLAVAGTSVADDGEMFRKNVSKNADEETGHAALTMLPLFVPPQGANDTLLEPIDVLTVDGSLAVTQDYVQPLITHYSEGHVEGIDEEGYGGFPGHGQRDAFGAVSLDGGASWKTTNLSKSADLSSIKVRLDRRREPYPGDVGRSFMAADGNQVLVVWVSRYASGGNPNYAMTDEERGLVAAHLELNGTIASAGECTDGDLSDGDSDGVPCTYLEDYFAVAGSQGYSDLADEGLPLIGELPYAAVWAARGVLLPPADSEDISNFIWFKAERLSSAVRDANRPEAVCAKGAGCVVTWQEDPDGIRPGDGEGPGEGWSGAVAHHQTDIWYSYIDWDDFSLPQADDGTYGTFYEGGLTQWVIDHTTGMPAAAIPMSIPVRLTDNSMCVAEGDKPYCYADFDGSGTADFCADSVQVSIETPEGPTTEVAMCITEDGRLMRGNTASTRARLGLHEYSTTVAFDWAAETSDDNLAFFESIDSAWFYMAYEENKGLGEDGEAEVVSDDPAEKIDMGKNVWYHTFDMFTPELVSQGLMLNQPAIYPDDFSDPLGLLSQDTSLGYNFFIIDPDPIYETQAGLESTLYQAEIARRSSPISQDFYDAGSSGTVALQLWKQGIIRRGGPADIMGRRFVIPTTEAGDMVCTNTFTSYTLCTDHDQYEEFVQNCVSEEVLADGWSFNEDYRPNNGQCRGDDQPPKCYEFIDPDGNYTNEPEYDEVKVCDEGEWVPVESCSVSDTCRVTVTTTCGPVEYCDVDDANCTSEETSETVETCDGLGDSCTCDLVTTTTFDSTTQNPYDYANMACDTWAYTDGSNPRYVKGFCADPAINLSGNTILVGETCTDAVTCLDAFPFSDYFDDLAGGLPISKIFEWQQYGPDYGGAVTTPDPQSDDDTNLNDTSWANPYDVAKGHRGFMAGDMIMAMYAWSPNWKALTDAHDVFNLYARRSFDGGLTWSTTPATFEHTDGIPYSGAGTTTCEWMDAEQCDSGVTQSGECAVCTVYGAGEFEQARNLSQLTGSQVTVLDPRYAPTTRSVTETSITTLLPEGFFVPATDDYADDALRDPSRFFMVYETGQNSAYDAGEATPLDLFYSRAITWGDDYLVWLDDADESECLPSADLGLTGFCNEFDALEGWQDSESGEASVTASPGGMFFYAAWNQIDFEDHVEVASDAWFRRILFLDDYIPGELTTQ